jgi:very-short-patch-repair endonuclease
MFKDIARKYGCGCVEEEVFAVDLHDTNELYPKGTIRTYPVDLYITRRKPPYSVIVEIDGIYHQERQDKDKERDTAITHRYGINIIRFDKEALLSGEYSEERLVEILKL